MGLTRFRGAVLICFSSTVLHLLFGMATANVVLIGKNFSLSFDDIEANFAPSIKGSGECGVLSVAEPLDACSPLTNKVVAGPILPFALILRGGCTFDEKVRSAQKAGFKAAIVYDNEDSGALVSMAGNPGGVKIPAIFISKASGEVLKKYAGRIDVELWIIPTFENSAWSIMAISLICILTIAAALATCFFVRRHHIRRERPRNSHGREFHGMSSRLVKAMPSLIFTSVLEDNCTSITCAICLEDYSVGEKLRVLPCRHKFHACCVDSWLTTWRTFCPVCKQDARTSAGTPPASESTPLLSASLASSSATALSSVHSSPSASPIQIVRPRSVSTSLTHSLSSSPHVGLSLRSYGNSPALSISRSSADPRNTSSNRFHASHLMSSNSLGFPLSSPITSRYASPYIPSSSNASPSYLIASSSSRRPAPLCCSESAATPCPFASAHSLPGC